MRRPDSYSGTPSWDQPTPVDRGPSFAFEQENDITKVARALAAHGGGAVAFDLALDLVLNDMVEQAKVSTGATGAAIALARDGQMVCRATTGKDAPDLGVRVETTSGLSGACLHTGQIQHCADTEIDPRVDAHACRELGVRSMLVVPLNDDDGPFGILEVFSAQPNAFADRDVTILEELAYRIIAERREAEDGSSYPAEAAPLVEMPVRVEAEPGAQSPPAIFAEMEPERRDVWTTVLAVLVILAAVSLGVLIGWRGAVTGSKQTASPNKQVDAATKVNPPVDSALAAEPAPIPADPPAAKAATAEHLKASPGSAPMASDAPTGGLLVTKNGKVIYRAPGSTPVDSDTSGASRLIRRVQPEYPAEAKAAHIQGPVVLEVQVLGDGTVGEIETVTGNPLLVESAVHAVRQWKYQPNFVDGRPVQSQTRITIKFVLPSN